MGKSGAALREQKAQKGFTITREWLEEHDKQVRRNYVDQCLKTLEKEKDEYQKKVWAEVDKEWKEREKLFMTQDRAHDLANIIQMVAYIAAEVLIEDFGWIVPKRQLSTSKILRFANAFGDRLSAIGLDEKMDIRKTNEQFTKKYGIEFLTLED